MLVVMLKDYRNAVFCLFCRNCRRTARIHHTGNECTTCRIPGYILLYIQNLANFIQRLADFIRDLNDPITHFLLCSVLSREYRKHIVVNTLAFILLNNPFRFLY